MVSFRQLSAGLGVAGLVGLGLVAMPAPAEAWWRGGWCCGVRFGVFLPPFVVAPAPVYVPPPVYYPPPVAYYAPPPRVWIAPHWQGNVWVPGHWG
ncbi:MAG: hypothetical protein WDN25_07655 [Acetobacteraceae bacterium]